MKKSERSQASKTGFDWNPRGMAVGGAVVALLYLAVGIALPKFFFDVLWINSLLLLTLPTATIFILNGYRVPTQNTISRNNVIKIYAAHVLTVAAMVILVYQTLHPIGVMIKQSTPTFTGIYAMFGVSELEQVGPLASGIFRSCLTIAVAAYLLLCVLSVKRSAYLVPLVYLNFTCALVLFSLDQLLRNMADPDSLLPAIAAICTTAAIGVVVCLVGVGAVAVLARRKKQSAL